MNWASEQHAKIWWRTVCKLFERPCRLMVTISIRESDALRPNNTAPWQTNLETTEG
jgi:hypothetical protein